jgi:ATP-binding cassette subfamily F protein 3
MEQRVVPFKFPQPDRLSPPIVTMEDASVGYEPGKPILSHLDLRIDQDDVIALLGANGNGKSTFAKLLSDRLKAETGRVRRSPTLKIGYFAQHQLDELNEAWTPYQYYEDLLPDKTEAQRRAQLGAVGFGKEKADTKIQNLSGGEKARLLLALAVFAKPHMLILDEPTNHLDVDSREALVQAIIDFEGAVLLISHDRHLISLCADRLWLVEDGGVHSFEGDIDDYREHLLALRRGSRNQKRRKGDETRAEARRAKAARREDLQPLKDEIAKWEGAIEKLNGQIAKIDDALADQVTYAGPPERAAKLNRKRAEIVKMIEGAESRWLTASDAYEEALKS